MGGATIAYDYGYYCRSNMDDRDGGVPMGDQVNRSRMTKEKEINNELCVCLCMHTCVYVHVSMCTCACICACVCTYACIHVSKCHTVCHMSFHHHSWMRWDDRWPTYRHSCNDNSKWTERDLSCDGLLYQPYIRSVSDLQRDSLCDSWLYQPWIIVSYLSHGWVSVCLWLSFYLLDACMLPLPPTHLI